MDGTISRQERRGWQSAGSKANREKSPAKASSIVNKKEHTRTDTKTKQVMDTGIHPIYTTRGAR